MAGEEEKTTPKEAARESSSSSSILSPGFRSVAAMAGWDEESLLAGMVVEDTPERDSKRKKRSSVFTPKNPPSDSRSRRRRGGRRGSLVSIPVIALNLDDDDVPKEGPANANAEDMKKGEIKEQEGKESKEEDKVEKESSKPLPCMDQLREELSCAICLEICFEPSTTPCGHSFCLKCLKYSAMKCGKRCPKCRQLISNGRACTVNTVLWNTIQLLFPNEVAARKAPSESPPPPPPATSARSKRAAPPLNSNSSFVMSSELVRMAAATGRPRARPTGGPSQSEDAAMALRLQREEFVEARRRSGRRRIDEAATAEDGGVGLRSSLDSARATLRAIAARAVHVRGRSGRYS